MKDGRRQHEKGRRTSGSERIDTTSRLRNKTKGTDQAKQRLMHRNEQTKPDAVNFFVNGRRYQQRGKGDTASMNYE